MGKKGKGKKGSKTPYASGGEKHQAQARQALCRLQMKIKRWEGYRMDEQIAARGNHRGIGAEPWDTRGMLGHIKLLKKTIAAPVKSPT